MTIVARLAWSAWLLVSRMQAAEAQTVWPGKPIKVIVPFPAGGQLEAMIARRPDDKRSPELPQVGLA